jgi:uncharacterized protein
MYKGYKIIDADSHVIEPNDLWEKYIDKKYLALAPKAQMLNQGHFQFDMKVGGHHFSFPDYEPTRPYIPDSTGKMLTYEDAYREFIDAGFSAKSYLSYLDSRGLDYIVLYPSLGLFATAVPGLDSNVAAAIRRAYNDWLYDFCGDGEGKLLGVGSLDLRNVDLAIAEARRCVNELGFKSLYVLPDPPLKGIPLNHPYYDELWAEIADLGVPLGIHEAAEHMFHPPGVTQVAQSGISYATKALSFGLGAMVSALVICGGGICERHPTLRIIFNESTAGWTSTWLWYIDELWEREMNEHSTPEKPSSYFRRQCYVSAEPEEPAIKYVIEVQGDDNILFNTDFPHPSEAKVSNPTDEFLELEGVSEDSRRKILWDNASQLYGLE